MSALFFCSFALGRLGSEFFEQRIEALVVLFEDLAVPVDSSTMASSNRFGFEFVRHAVAH